MLANNLPLHTPLIGGAEEGWGSKDQCVFISESCHVAYQVNGNVAENPMQGNILPFEPPTTYGSGQKIITFFLRSYLYFVVNVLSL